MAEASESLEQQAWLTTPTGLLFSRIVQTVLKVVLVFVSTKMPSLGLGKEMDTLVQELSPVVALSICVAWTTWQHNASHATNVANTEKAVSAALDRQLVQFMAQRAKETKS